jgi:limonene-1,2-epoxide hydrolase
MTDQTSTVPAVDTKALVERFLFAVQNEDFDTADSLLADDVKWQNVGLPTITGRERIVKLLRSGQGRVGFEVKFHRIAAEGTSVLTERTDVLVFGSVLYGMHGDGAGGQHPGALPPRDRQRGE